MAERMHVALRWVARVLPGASDYTGLRRSWRGDLLAGLTVVTAIVAGIVAAVFGGSSVQVSGPTGAMAVVLVPIVAHDGVGAVASVAIMAGVIVLIMGLAGLGRLIQFVPWPVLEGFTVGIAVTIALQQVPLLLGESKGTGSTVLDSAWQAVSHLSRSTAADTLVLGILVVVVMTTWPRLTKRVPSSIVAVVAVTLLSVLLHLSVPTIGALPHRLPSPQIPDLGLSTLRHLAGPAVAVAILAAIESLLSARVADAMTVRWSDKVWPTWQPACSGVCPRPEPSPAQP